MISLSIAVYGQLPFVSLIMILWTRFTWLSHFQTWLRVEAIYGALIS